MSLFAPASTIKHLVEFNAGKCIVEGNLIKPDLRKGKIYMDQGDDQLLHLYWKERKNQATPEDDLVIFPDEAEFTRITQCTTGRVYLLKFKTSNERHFYWMQNKNDENDQELVEKVNELIRDPDTNMNLASELDESTSHAELLRLLNNVENQDPNITPENVLQFLNSMNGSQNLQDSETSLNEQPETTATPIEAPTVAPTVAPAETENPTEVSQPKPTKDTTVVTTEETSSNGNDQASSSAQPTAEQVEQFRQLLASMNNTAGSSAPISLNDVLNSQTVTPLLNDTKICESLFPYLPDESEKSVNEVRQVIKSPQFSQALQSLSFALHTGQLGPLLSQLGLDYNAGNSVESFLNAINEQAKKNKNNDAMEED